MKNNNNIYSMKQFIKLSISFLLIIGLYSCQNDDWDFPDFDYTTAYFPYQFPVRTLVLGDYNFDNSKENEGKFLISATMGGVYENKEDIIVNFKVDESLTDNLYNNSLNSPLLPLPNRYYTLSSSDKILIPKGQFSGGVEVQLTEAFFSDPLAVEANYVIPLRITSATTDSVLMGSPSVTNPDPRIPGEWVLTPKNYTLFAVRFVNEYHGKYLLRGKSIVRNQSNTLVETIAYSRPEVEQDEVVSVLTRSKNSVTYGNAIRLSDGSPGAFKVTMTFSADGNCTIKEIDDHPFTVTGNGKFVKDGDEWGGEKRHVIHLKYQINDGTFTHTVTDTLVFRDKAVKFAEFKPLIEK